MSDYFKSLDAESFKRYMEKIQAINNVDPYLLNMKECSENSNDLPQIMYPDIVNYFVYTKSAFTNEDFKAYKSLEAYKLVTCGWVKSIHSKRFGGNVIVLGKVMHSQRLREPPLKPWVIASEDGTILSAHCNCTAGLGEACSHVGALVFAVDNIKRQSAETPPVSCTDVKSKWTVPGNLGEPSKVKNIDFSKPSTSRTKDEALFWRDKWRREQPPITKSEITSLLNKLKDTEKGSVLHSVVRPFSTEIAEERKEKKRHVLTTLYKLEYEGLSLEALKQIGAHINLNLTIDECSEIEKMTSKQAESKMWFHYRAGRITASNFKAVCRTSLEKPSMSLIKNICYPLERKFKTAATIWGCKHEKQALSQYTQKMCTSHGEFGTEPIGLSINPQYPHFGVSLDGLVSCECCGLGCVEIKCPFCAKDLDLKELSVLKKLGIVQTEEGRRLSFDHKYYYQIQMQLGVTRVQYCDFVLWTNKDIYIERVYLNEHFWETESAKATEFFRNVVLPELLGKYFSKYVEKKTDLVDWDVSNCT